MEDIGGRAWPDAARPPGTLPKGTHRTVRLTCCHSGFSFRPRSVGHVVRRVGHDEVRLMTIHKQREVLRQRGIAAYHAVTAQRSNIALLHEGLQLIRVDVAVIVLHVLVMELGEQVVHLRSVKAGRAEVITGKLQVGQQIRQRFRLPFADRLVERDVQRLLVLGFSICTTTQSISFTPSATSTLYRWWPPTILPVTSFQITGST